MASVRVRDGAGKRKESPCSETENNISAPIGSNGGMRIAAAILLALVLAAPAAADPKQVKPDRAAIDRLLDEFVPAVVAGKDLKRGWKLVAGPARTVSYSYPGDVGFDILLQPTKPSLGAWSFRAEAQKIGGSWKITTWYPVATFAPADQTQTVLGPNDPGPANGASAAGVSRGRLGSWVLLTPVLGVGLLAAGALGFAGIRVARRRARVAEIRRSLAAKP